MTTTATEDQPSTTSPIPWEPFPEIDLRQLIRMSDDTGMFQHAIYAMPDPNHGYCIDDNCRALIAALLYHRLRGDVRSVIPIDRYLQFLAYAFNDDTGRFRNFMGYDRRWLEPTGSQDSQARTIWALGIALQYAPDDDFEDLASNLINKALPGIEDFQWIRSYAFALFGLDEVLKAEPGHALAKQIRDDYAQRLFKAWQEHATDAWPWWEDELTYDNAKLCHALIITGKTLGRQDMVDAGLKSLAWLFDVQQAPEGHLSIIGNQGWFRRGQKPAAFDQQPLEAYAMVHACLKAGEVTGDPVWDDRAWICFEWFRGQNDLGVPLYNAQTGGCQDGLNADGPNRNQGAESTLAYLLSVLELHLYRERRVRRIQVTPPKTVGYAIVGASDFAKFCLENYRQIEGLEPIAVWNRTTSKAEALAKDQGIRAYDDLAAMCADPAVDLVHVATTPARHAEHAMPALEAGKHVLCEKPIATSLKDAQTMIETAGRRGVLLGVNFVMRHGPLAEPMKQIVQSGALGAPLRGSFTNRAGDSGLPLDHWFWNASESGGIFVEHGVHFFDLMRHWLGAGEVLTALRLRRPGTPKNKPTIVDQVACDVRYGPQTTVNFYHGFCHGKELDRQDLRLIFERGEIRLDGWVASRIEITAVLEEDDIEAIAAALPAEAQIKTLENYPDGTTTSRRHRDEAIDRHVRITWEDPRDKQTIYGSATHDLMNDMLETIRDGRRNSRVTAADGLAALTVALDADRLAKGVNP